MPEAVAAPDPVRSTLTRFPDGPPRPLEPSGASVQARTWSLAAVFLAAALLLYLPDVGHPQTIVFDELHYVTVAREHAAGRFINETWGDRGLPYNFEHPPAAKFLIWGGVELVGDEARGWRAASSLVGAAGVGAAFVLGRRLFDSEVAGAATAVYVMADGLYFLQARMAMLDVFPAAFAVAAFAMALGPDGERRASGILYGLAVASKYNAIFLLPVFFLVHWIRRPARNGPLRSAMAGLWSAGVPMLVLYATYLPFLMQWMQRGGLGYTAINWFLVQAAALSWDFAADSTHPFSSTPWQWWTHGRPVWYYVSEDPSGAIEKIYSLGNPLLWWTGATAAVTCLVAAPVPWLVRWRAVLTHSWFWTHIEHVGISWDRGSRLFLAGLLVAASWTPYLLIQRVTFMYYMTSVVPLLALVTGGLYAWALQRRGIWAILAGLHLGLSVAWFVVWFPLVAGRPLDPSASDQLMGILPWMRR